MHWSRGYVSRACPASLWHKEDQTPMTASTACQESQPVCQEPGENASSRMTAGGVCTASTAGTTDLYRCWGSSRFLADGIHSWTGPRIQQCSSAARGRATSEVQDIAEHACPETWQAGSRWSSVMTPRSPLCAGSCVLQPQKGLLAAAESGPSPGVPCVQSMHQSWQARKLLTGGISKRDRAEHH